MKVANCMLQHYAYAPTDSTNVSLTFFVFVFFTCCTHTVLRESRQQQHQHCVQQAAMLVLTVHLCALPVQLAMPVLLARCCQWLVLLAHPVLLVLAAVQPALEATTAVATLQLLL
jgi:hypothetical protein